MENSKKKKDQKGKKQENIPKKKEIDDDDGNGNVDGNDRSGDAGETDINLNNNNQAAFSLIDNQETNESSQND